MKKVYVKQPQVFQDIDFPHHVLKLEKDPYGLKKELRAWYKRLSKFLQIMALKVEIANALFLKYRKNNLLIVQIYVDDIIFRATSESLYDEFAKLIRSTFKMSMMGELNFLLGLKIK